jgi:hypothetical protein
MHNSQPQVSKIPFSKWYVKDYYNRYDIEKMFEVYNNYDNNDDNPCVNKINKKFNF